MEGNIVQHAVVMDVSVKFVKPAIPIEKIHLKRKKLNYTLPSSSFVRW